MQSCVNYIQVVNQQYRNRWQSKLACQYCANTGWQFWMHLVLQFIDTHPRWCWETKRQTPLSPLTNRPFGTDGWMLQGRNKRKNWSWRHFTMLGVQKGHVVINPCWERIWTHCHCVYKSVSTLLVSSFHYGCPFHVSSAITLKMTKVRVPVCLWRLWLIFCWCENKRMRSNYIQVWLLLL